MLTIYVIVLEILLYIQLEVVIYVNFSV